MEKLIYEVSIDDRPQKSFESLQEAQTWINLELQCGSWYAYRIKILEA